ncbi:hypothetical protein VNO80_17386 [Phaseolus coccineus]|uniref:Uncharacterized protein n=1 Tax=Phaseolus coccineus TaxID=3886 RepID=A0AAN9MCL6_PHACN
MVLRIESECSGSRNGRYAAIRTVRDARQGGSAAVGSTTLVARGFGTRPYAAGGESPESTGSTEATTYSGSTTGRYEYRHRSRQQRKGASNLPDQRRRVVEKEGVRSSSYGTRFALLAEILECPAISLKARFKSGYYRMAMRDAILDFWIP